MQAISLSGFNFDRYKYFFNRRLKSSCPLELLAAELDLLVASGEIVEDVEFIKGARSEINNLLLEKENTSVFPSKAAEESSAKEGQTMEPFALQQPSKSTPLNPGLKSCLSESKRRLLKLENLLVLDSSTTATDQTAPTQLMVKKQIKVQTTSREGLESFRSANSDADHELILKQDRAEQEKLTELLADTVGRIKNHSQSLNEKFSSESSRMNGLEDKMFQNKDKISKEREAIKKVSSGTWSTTILIWGSILVAILVFAWAFLYVRLISPVAPKTARTTSTIIKTVSTTLSESPLPTSTHHHHDHHDQYHEFDPFEF